MKIPFGSIPYCCHPSFIRQCAMDWVTDPDLIHIQAGIQD